MFAGFEFLNQEKLFRELKLKIIGCHKSDNMQIYTDRFLYQNVGYISYTEFWCRLHKNMTLEFNSREYWNLRIMNKSIVIVVIISIIIIIIIIITMMMRIRTAWSVRTMIFSVYFFVIFTI